MEEAKKEEKLVTPVWANLVVCCLGIVIGIVAISDAITYFTAENAQGASFLIGSINLIAGIAMIVMGIIGVINSRRNSRLLLISSYSEPFIYSILSVFSSFCLAYAYSQLTAEDAARQMILDMMVGTSIFLGIVYIAVAVLEGIAIHKIRKGKSFLVISLVGTAIFLLLELASLNGISPAMPRWPIIVLLCLLLIAMGSFLITIAIMTETNRKRKPVTPAPYGLAAPKKEEDPSMSEAEKAKLLMEYKDLLDQGLITREEFERKKKDILGE